MELLEYLEYHYAQKNSELAEILQKLWNESNDNQVPEVISNGILLALRLSQGYTQYNAKLLAQNIGVSKTAIKYMVNKLTEENKIEMIKENNITFIRPIV